MEIFVVITLYPYEGYSEPFGVFSSEALAKQAVLNNREWYKQRDMESFWKEPEIIQYTLDKEERY